MLLAVEVVQQGQAASCTDITAAVPWLIEHDSPTFTQAERLLSALKRSPHWFLSRARAGIVFTIPQRKWLFLTELSLAVSI